MISVPKGMLRIAALRMLSESSLSGVDLQNQLNRASSGEWTPGPGSIYFMLGELRDKGLVVELPRRGGTTRRYIISNKGRQELDNLSKEALAQVGRQLRLLSFYSFVAGDAELQKKVNSLADTLRKDRPA